jgi:hypothetical protein
MTQMYISSLPAFSKMGRSSQSDVTVFAFASYHQPIAPNHLPALTHLPLSAIEKTAIFIHKALPATHYYPGFPNKQIFTF